MKKEIKVPSMGESISEAIIGEILKPSGSVVKEDEEILELETDKVNQVLYAPAAGTITLNVETDQTVAIGDVIGFIDSDGKAEEPKEEKPKKEEEPRKEEELKTAEEPKKEEKPTTTPAGSVSRTGKEEFVASLSKNEMKPKPQPKPKEVKGEREETRHRMTKIRRVISERLVEAKNTTAMLTTFNEVDMSAVMELRKHSQEEFVKKFGVKLGFMSFFVKAVVHALQVCPEVNSYLDGDAIVERHYYDIGIAVGTERGLVVPVLRNCDSMNFAEIEEGIISYAKKAREGGLSVDDLQGGSFTITNGGIYGSLLSTPILNPPQSGILGMHKIQERPIAENGQVVIKPMMYLALSYDHRLIDGKEAVTFLVEIKKVLEEPARLLLEV